MSAREHGPGAEAAANATRWIEANFDLKAALAAVDEGNGQPPPVWRAAVDLGWLAARVPEQHGGLGLPLAEFVELLRALGAGVLPGPWFTSMLAIEALIAGGTTAQQSRWLPRLASGAAIGTVAGTRFEALPLECDGDRLSGPCGPVAYAAPADVIILATPATEGRARLSLVERKADGVHTSPCGSIDGTWRVDLLSLKGARTEPLADAAAAERWFQVGALLTAADLLGLAERAIQITVDYAKLRRQFDRPIGANQAVKHPIVDAWVAMTMATKGLRHAAAGLDAGSPDAAHLVSVTKAKANDAAREAASAMIQFHGAIGFTWPHPAHLFFKRAKRQEYEFGDSILHRERVARYWIAEVN